MNIIDDLLGLCALICISMFVFCSFDFLIHFLIRLFRI